MALVLIFIGFGLAVLIPYMVNSREERRDFFRYIKRRFYSPTKRIALLLAIAGTAWILFLCATILVTRGYFSEWHWDYLAPWILTTIALWVVALGKFDGFFLSFRDGLFSFLKEIGGGVRSFFKWIRTGDF